MDGKDEIFYTVDGIPARTVFICWLSSAITSELLENNLKNKFGCIESVRLCKNTNSLFCSVKCVLITFACAKVAAKAINTRLVIEKEIIYIQAADTWLQPASTKETSEIINSDDTEDNKEFSLLLLNDDCLLHLYTFLNLIDIANLSKTCNRLHKLSKPIIKKNSEIVRLDSYDSFVHKYTVMDIRTLMINIGLNIQSITLNGNTLDFPDHSRYIDTVYRFCPNLQQLHLHYIDLCYYENYDHIDNPECLLKKLKVLQLYKCYNSFNDSIYSTLFQSFKKLETINIQRCQDVPLIQLIELLSSNANTLTDVTLLLLNYYPEHGLTTIKELLGGSLKNLKHLNTDIPVFNEHNSTRLSPGELNNIKTLYIRHYERITLRNVSQIIHELSVNNRQIVELDISYAGFDDFLMENALIQLKTLKVLKMDSVEHLQSTFLINCAEKLKQLCIFSLQKANISDENVVQIVDYANKLIELDVVECKNVTWNVIQKVANVLKPYPDRPKLKLIIGFLSDVNNDMTKLDEKCKNLEIIDFYKERDRNIIDSDDEEYINRKHDYSDMYYDYRSLVFRNRRDYLEQ